MVAAPPKNERRVIPFIVKASLFRYLFSPQISCGYGRRTNLKMAGRRK